MLLEKDMILKYNLLKMQVHDKTTNDRYMGDK